MNQVNQGESNDAAANMPVKRKRGRPRKDQSLKNRAAAQVRPGLGRANKNQPLQGDTSKDSTDSIVGKAVTGVVEAAFDAGYLITVKIGNSNTSLRGVVFKPGHYIPLSAENDVAPCVQTIRRHEIPLPVDSLTRVPSRHSKSRGRKERQGDLRLTETGYLLNVSPSANQVHQLAPQTADMAASRAYAVPSMGSTGNLMPVVLLPVSVSNVFPPSHAATSKHRPAVPSQVPPPQPQTNYQATPKGLQNDFHHGRTQVSSGEEVKSIEPTEVIANESVQVSSQTAETNNQSNVGASKSLAEDSGLHVERESDNMSVPLIIRPLQAIHSNVHNQYEAVPMPSQNNKIGRMSELLQAVQVNMTETDVTSVKNHGHRN